MSKMASRREERCRRVLLLPLLISFAHVANAVLPTATLDVTPTRGAPYTLLASMADFSSYVSMDKSLNPTRVLVKPPPSNFDMCEEVTESMVRTFRESLKTDDSVLLFVPRGECAYERKAYHSQQLGADAVVIYHTLASRYSINKTGHEGERYPSYSVEDIIYPKEFYDYDCSKGRAAVPSTDMVMKPLPYNAEHNDPLLTGTTEDSLCFQYSHDKLRNCPTKQCLLTGKHIDDTKSMMEACCAWDFHTFLSFENVSKPLGVNITVGYVTYEQSRLVLDDMNDGTVHVKLSARHRPKHNPSSFIIWMLGVTVAAVAAYMSAGDYHYMIRKLSRSRHSQSIAVQPGDRSSGSGTRVRRNEPALAQNEDQLELNAAHALGFIVMASSGLLILFYFKIYAVVKVFYAFGCSSAVMQVIFAPLCRKIAKRSGIRETVVWKTNTEEFGDVTQIDIIAGILGYSLGFTWLYVAFTVYHPSTNMFFWVVQDIFGACMCVVFLSLIKLNSIRVASVLLIVAFVYDIFFVFVTPLLFKGKSVMITVATSGGPPAKDEIWCEKYPDDKDCQGGDPLPMLFTIPYFGDYAGGASMLGLGDIVIPGLLLSLAARLDAAKYLVGTSRGNFGQSGTFFQRCCSVIFCRGCYFPPLVVSYGVGLFMANAAVHLMRMGQPALLYLVPCTLGTMTLTAFRRNELRGLWDGPRILDAADEIAYGPASSGGVLSDGGGSDGDDSFVESGEADADPLLSSDRSRGA